METIACGNSERFRNVLDLADRYAASQWPVLVLGETGVGKELIARRIHKESHRRSEPFIEVNCAAIPDSLFESELFGFERGSFSGAVQSSRGLIRAAHGGSLFLDEMGELNYTLQAKLLRFLDTGEVRSIGSQRSESADVRIIAATNVDLFRAAVQDTFRLDLLERLSVLQLQVPPLRERMEDLPLIARCLLEQMGIRGSVDSEVLSQYHWPGNIRQLRNVLIRATVRQPGLPSAGLLKQVLEEEKEAAGRMEDDQVSFWDGSLEDIERKVIVERLRQCQGNRKLAAQRLGIAKSTLHEKLRRWKTESSYWPVVSSVDIGVHLH